MRTVEFMEQPSMRHRMTWVRCAVSSLFILPLCLLVQAHVNMNFELFHAGYGQGGKAFPSAMELAAPYDAAPGRTSGCPYLWIVYRSEEHTSELQSPMY